MSRNAKLAVVILAVVAIAVALIVTLAGAQQSSPLDAGLRKTAARFRVVLKQPNARYQGVFLNAFNLYQHDEQVALLKNMSDLSQSGQFEQVEVWETETMPPVYRLLRSRQEPMIAQNFATLSRAASGKEFVTTVQQGNLQFRALFAPIPVPSRLASAGTHAVLEVYKAES
jgi:hypothetical protein